MFTGLVQQLGSVVRVSSGTGGGRVEVRYARWPDPLQIGESMCVQGVCLTLTGYDERTFTCDLLDETLTCSNLGHLKPGEPVNLERALRPGDRLGGHFVTGHVDGIGILQDIRSTGRDRILHIACDKAMQPWIVPKGAVACDGVSLTVAEVATTGFSVHIIPHTWEVTSLCARQRGDSVNLEGDILGKYVRRTASHEDTPHREIGWGDLERAGFI